MSTIPTPAQALQLVQRYNQEEFHLHHAKTVGWVLGCLAQTHDPGHREYWQTVGILHDIDFEQWPQEHCEKAQQLLTELDIWIWFLLLSSMERLRRKICRNYGVGSFLIWQCPIQMII